MNMKTTDKWVLTIVTTSGLHTKISYGSQQREEAVADSIRSALVPGVVRVSVDLIHDYKANRIVRVWV